MVGELIGGLVGWQIVPGFVATCRQAGGAAGCIRTRWRAWPAPGPARFYRRHRACECAPVDSAGRCCNALCWSKN